ncbi:hypothetical protein HPP92_025806 [Vanilla planifolia]|uniref:LOB domain-containing protein n=1 Tax=Vanilla planifolia TaxID=51239 RepID=A0A835PGY4_VANPL|nr:hypothetical protein HPP92_026097 [Vanilla planifolia]KAG0452220.1 hypothetical protein HPP92_025806 [Vanilla planifolia]
MKMSCNGCRVLRKGCNDNCSIRPCLAWLKTPVAQANATVFLAKFYGRAGLLKLLSSAPLQLRPAVFRSLLYEASGRIVNPIHGSVGLLWSGGWQHCQAAVDAVLTGEPIPKVSACFGGGGEEAIKAGDIRHLSKEAAAGHHRAVKHRKRFKRSGARRVGEMEARGMSMEMPEMISSGKGRKEVEDDSFGVELELTLGSK